MTSDNDAPDAAILSNSRVRKIFNTFRTFSWSFFKTTSQTTPMIFVSAQYVSMYVVCTYVYRAGKVRAWERTGVGRGVGIRAHAGPRFPRIARLICTRLLSFSGSEERGSAAFWGTLRTPGVAGVVRARRISLTGYDASPRAGVYPIAERIFRTF